MPRRIGQPKAPQRRRKTFLKEWREYRKLSQERAASRFEMSGAQLSRIEAGKSPYTQDFLERAAEAYNCDVVSLLIRDPSQPDAIWSIWEQAKPGERALIVDLAKSVIKTGT